MAALSRHVVVRTVRDQGALRQNTGIYTVATKYAFRFSLDFYCSIQSQQRFAVIP